MTAVVYLCHACCWFSYANTYGSVLMLKFVLLESLNFEDLSDLSDMDSD